MTKAEFVEKFAEKTGFSKKDAAAAVDAYHAVVADAMKAGDKVVIPGVLKVEVTERAARTGRNPRTGEEMEIPAKKSIKAKFSDKLLG
ncbi:MAG: HU family DNA-binding protein [Mogibacterium sp.]|jgi:DNA-binding protein HU-beta|nr:HU family DNA-binding protein [Mogibacterium sp.]